MKLKPINTIENNQKYKFVAPTAMKDSIPRDAILKEVFSPESTPTVILQAPAGHGKSTALLQIKNHCDNSNILTGWITFDDTDNDARSFSNHLQALLSSLKKNCKEIKKNPLIGYEESYETGDFINHLLAIKKNIALFFDEFQVLHTPIILSFWRKILQYTPPNVRIFIGSRSLPEIGLPQLLVSNRAKIYRAEQLRFSSVEVQKFFKLFKNIEISESELMAIYYRTEGWPAAVQLFRLSLLNPTIRKLLNDITVHRPDELAEYLIESVLDLQTPQVRDFMLRTSVLKILTGELCDLITSRNDSHLLLSNMERSGLFVRNIDSENKWFKYHSLFASCLADQLISNEPKIAAETHRIAANWYYKQKLYEEALHHAIECENYTLASKALNDYSSYMIPNAHVTTIARWAALIPYNEIKSNPELAIKIAWAQTFKRDPLNENNILDLIDGLYGRKTASLSGADVIASIYTMCLDEISHSVFLLKDVKENQPTNDKFRAFELAAGADMRAHHAIVMGKLELAHRFLNESKAYHKIYPALFTGGYAACFKSITLLLQGKLHHAKACIKQGLDEQKALTDKSFVTAALITCQIWIYYEENNLEKVLSLYNENREILTYCTVPDFLVVGYIPVARCYIEQGENIKAIEILDIAYQIATINNWPRIKSIIQWEKIRQKLNKHDTEILPLTINIKPSSEEAWIPFSETLEGELFGKIRLALKYCNSEECENLLNKAFKLAGERIYIHIRLYIFDALLQKHNGNVIATHRSLRKALQLAEPGGYIRIFIEEGEILKTLLRAEHANTSSMHKLTDGLQKFIIIILFGDNEIGNTAQESQTLPIQKLTKRETEILSLLAEGNSNHEVANKLFVSENTVKYHLKNIYYKLSASSRTQAINIAKKSGLLN